MRKDSNIPVANSSSSEATPQTTLEHGQFPVLELMLQREITHRGPSGPQGDHSSKPLASLEVV
jgi:hypothetical protein